jgi:two-component system, OmpR family, sensor histidine kinase AdeS
MKLQGMSRQIAVSMVAMAFGLTLLVVLMTYVFYYLTFRIWPEQCKVLGWAPTGPEWSWLIATTLTCLAFAVAVSVKLAHRLLVPLDAVANGIRRVAQGDLTARAHPGDRSLYEAAALADDFNALAGKLQRVTHEQAFWNAAIAHELRTPLTVLRGRLQGLADGVFAPDATQFRSLLTHVEGLTRLIEDLRVISLAESGHLELHIDCADLSVDVRDLLEVFSDALHAAGQHATLDLTPARMRCDPLRIRQALLALLDNARRYAVPGAIRIRTRVEDGICRLYVEDDGPGIPAELAPHVFDAFRRAADHRGAKDGSGLGLAVVAAIARAHEGQATCRRLDGGGTRFELSWPNDVAPLRARNAA